MERMPDGRPVLNGIVFDSLVEMRDMLLKIDDEYDVTRGYADTDGNGGVVISPRKEPSGDGTFDAGNGKLDARRKGRRNRKANRAKKREEPTEAERQFVHICRKYDIPAAKN